MRTKRHLFVPEVIQASAMDCGPASLKSVLEGFGIPVSYGRLREACQTDVDGTSIDTLEALARRLGIDAEQVMLPLDHLFLSEAQSLPAIVVVVLPNRVTHFLVVWSQHGRMLQLMDPASGRRWVTKQRFLEEVYVHKMSVPAEGWREWAGSEASVSMLRRRFRDLGISDTSLLEIALAHQGWHKLGALDAALRLVTTMVSSGGIGRGPQAARLLEHLLASEELIADEYWSVRPNGDEELTLRGAVLVRLRGALPHRDEEQGPLSPELAAALEEKPVRPGRELLKLLRADGVFSPAFFAFSFLIAAGGVVLEAVLFRGLFDLGRELGLFGQRLGAILAVLLFLALLLSLEFPLTFSLLKMGRHLETRLRQVFLEKIPRLGDRYFQSRLKSDMAERAHMIHRVRRLPDLGGQLLRGVCELILTAAGIAWLDPRSAPLAIGAACAALLLPLSLQPLVAERDLRVRSHVGALCRYYLDALLGLVPIQVHGAQRAVRREHGKLLVDWVKAGLGVQRVVVWAEAVQFAIGFGLAAWLLFGYLARSGEGGTVLLLIYWALNLPVIGQDIATVAWQYPAYRNMTLRLLEPIGALEEQSASARELSRVRPATQPSVSIRIENLTVQAGGHTILSGINTEIPSGTHVAIVGPSGAGKSSLVGALLGWWRPSQGQILVDGEPLLERLDALRSETAWVDPAVHLWNRSFFENVRYGCSNGYSRPMAQVIETADLRNLLEKLPDGFGTSLGEGGALVSGGEGQRVRLARAIFRSNTRLVILDEPFRGLDREQRQKLLCRIRALWRGLTVLCVTHDISETRDFGRVLVLENGQLIEDGVPAVLAETEGSRYRALLKSELALRTTAWSDATWRRLRVDDGNLCAAHDGSLCAAATERPS